MDDTRKKLKILYLHQYFQTPTMSGGTRSFEMARRLVAAGHEVHVVTSMTEPMRTGKDSWTVTNEAGIRVHWVAVQYSNLMGFHERVLAFLKFAWLAARRSARIDADVVFATSTPLTIALPAVYAAAKRRVPMVFEVRDLWPAVPIELGVLKNPLLIWMARKLERLAYRRSERVVALAPGMKDAVVATGYPDRRVTVIPNGADLDLFQVNEDIGQQLRLATGWLRDRPMILYCGALGAVNGTEFLVRLASAVNARDPEVCFVIIGRGNCQERMRAEARRLGILDTSFFMLGAKPKVELPQWLSACDIALALINGPKILWSNATQNKFFDALAAGRPVACNFRGFQSQVAEDEGCGFIMDGEDPEAAAQLLLARLRDREWLATASAKAQNLACGRFNRDALAGELMRTLEQAVDSYDAQRG